jgi:glycosyltransferase involved in cell wall biosynthesis
VSAGTPAVGGDVLAPAPSATVDPLAEPPSFSIVIPAYQAAATIGEALQSAVGQVHPAHEIIVVDDGSTDELEAALAPFMESITLIRQENGGSASARNAGAAAATGDFLAILDADDAYHPRRLEALAALARERPDLDLVTTDARFMAGDQPVGTFHAHNRFATTGQRAAILESCFVGGWPAVRLAKLRAIGEFDQDLVVGHDWDAWLRMILAGSVAGMVDQPFYDYRLSSGGLTSRRTTSLWDRVRLLEKAGRNPALRPEERPVLDRSLRNHRSRAVLAEVHDALYGARPRPGLARLIGLRGIALRARLAAALSLIAPPLARRLVPPEPGGEHELAAESP